MKRPIHKRSNRKRPYFTACGLSRRTSTTPYYRFVTCPACRRILYRHPPS